MQPTQKPVTGVEPTPADTLRHAALYLRRHGWIRGDYYEIGIDPFTGADSPDPTPRCCTLGAIAMAAYGRQVDNPFGLRNSDADVFRYTTEVLRDHLELNVFGPPQHPGEPDITVSRWNDDYVVSVDEVIETLEAAAEEWDFFHRILTASGTAGKRTSGGAE